jgi:hypothetical protein
MYVYEILDSKWNHGNNDLDLFLLLHFELDQDAQHNNAIHEVDHILLRDSTLPNAIQDFLERPTKNQWMPSCQFVRPSRYILPLGWTFVAFSTLHAIIGWRTHYISHN